MTAVNQTLLLTQWQLRRQAQYIPLLVVVQVALSVTTVLGYSLLVGDTDPSFELYLATGAPTITLITVGLVMTPQMVAVARTEGSLDWIRTLPVPRAGYLVADLAVWTVIALPGMVLGVVVGAWTFGITLSVAWWIVPAVLLVSLTAASVGYALATLLPPQVAQLLSQLIIFVVLLFSPVSYPAERMPSWLQAAHEWLPVQPMAELMRAGLASDVFTIEPRSLLVLIAWCVIAVGGALAALRRRG